MGKDQWDQILGFAVEVAEKQTDEKRRGHVHGHIEWAEWIKIPHEMPDSKKCRLDEDRLLGRKEPLEMCLHVTSEKSLLADANAENHERHR
jgi:hypothetical protein